jgi:hypothetical protein
MKKIFLLTSIMTATCLTLCAQSAVSDTTLSEEQQKALQLLNSLDTTIASKYWPNVAPVAFFNNVKKNILYPEKIYQGHNTNFCGYSALSVVLCRTQPLKYTGIILSLYVSGQSRVGDITLQPSALIRETAGNLQGKGKLNVNPADQLWLLTLPDHFKGYMNTFNKKYEPGDESKMWAATTLAKFSRMAGKLGGFKNHVVGSDLLRPKSKNNLEYIQSELSKGNVILYVNSKFLHPGKFRIYNLRAPTHFIVLYDIKEVDHVIALKYWDYGLKTVQLIPGKRLEKLIYGIIRLNL